MRKIDPNRTSLNPRGPYKKHSIKERFEKKFRITPGCWIWTASLVDGGYGSFSIDRIDNDGNYEPGNCRWATRLEQERNKSTNRYFTIKGEKKALSEWCEIYGAPYQRVHARLLLGWDIERALTAPHRDEKQCLHGIASSAPCAQCEQEIEATE